MTKPILGSNRDVPVRDAVTQRKHSLLSRLWKQRYMQIFALAGLVYIFIFNLLPLFGTIIAFKNYRISSGIQGMFTSDWVGLKHFKMFFEDRQFWSLLTNTLSLSLWKLFFVFPIPILFAILLNEVRNKKYKKIVQTVSYLPYFVSWVVIAGLIQIFASSTGVINSLLLKLGFIDSPNNYLTSPEYFRSIAVISAVWKETGWWTIIFLAAITGIDVSLYEAAEVDGANRIQRIIHITLPALKPTICTVLILAVGSLMGGGLGNSNFQQSYLLGNQGNMEAADILETYVMRIGLEKGRYSYATAAGVFQSFISIILVYLANLTSKKLSGQGLV